MSDEPWRSRPRPGPRPHAGDAATLEPRAGRVVGLWALGSLAVSAALLYLVWAVSHRVTPDTRELLLPGINEPAGLTAVAQVLARNSLVLALHAFACVAGFIAGSELPAQVDRHRGVWCRVHTLAGPLAIVFVAGATLFSLGTQAFALGSDAATLAAQIEVYVWPSLLWEASPVG